MSDGVLESILAELERVKKERDEEHGLRMLLLDAMEERGDTRLAAEAERDRLAEALRLLLDGHDPHGAEAERIARAALASMEGDKDG
jgi:hypothetical protein